jgi:hypothetical protein
VWQAVDLLRERGAAVSEIDAGYVVNGWLHYAHPDDAPRGPDGERIFPWVAHPGGVTRYQVANRALPGWQVRGEVPYRRWLGRSGSVFVLEREPGIR